MEKRDKILEGALKLMIKNCLRHTSTIELNRETLLEYGFKKKTVEKLLAQTSSPTLDTDQVFTFDQDEVIMSEFKHDLNESKFSEDLLNRQ